MKKHSLLTIVIAFFGTCLLWIPFLFLLVTSLFGTIRSGVVRFDYLLIGEMFPLILLGGGLIIATAFREKRFWKLLLLLYVSAIGLLFGSQGLAIATGIASGTRPPEGVWWIVVLGGIILYSLLSLVLAIYSAILFKRIIHPKPNK